MSWYKSDKTTADEAVNDAHDSGQKAGAEGRSRVFNNPVNDLRVSDQATRERKAYNDGYDNGASQPRKR